ncbi:MAG: Spy/CpxP family protein refolding chaperone [Burkholderiales bacterium]
MKISIVTAAIAALVLSQAALAQRSDPRSLESILKSLPPKGDDARMTNANLPELVNMRMSQLEEDLNLTAAQMPQWKAYRSRVMDMLDDMKRGARVSASETNAVKRLDGLADLARNRLAAVEDIVEAGKALYAVLTPAQKEVADRRLALPLATLTGNDAGSDVRNQGRPPAPK